MLITANFGSCKIQLNELNECSEGIRHRPEIRAVLQMSFLPPNQQYQNME